MATAQRDVEELEHEIVFHEVLLETLDIEAEDFAQSKLDLEQKLNELRSKLRDLTDTSNGTRTPSTSPTHNSFQSPQSLALPSRDRPAHNTSYSSPSYLRHTSPTSRTNEPAHVAGEHRERSYTSEQLVQDTTKTRRNFGSLDFSAAERDLEQRHSKSADVSSASLKQKFEDMQRAREEQYKQAQEDERLAWEIWRSTSDHLDPSGSNMNLTNVPLNPFEQYLDYSDPQSSSFAQSIPASSGLHRSNASGTNVLHGTSTNVENATLAPITNSAMAPPSSSSLPNAIQISQPHSAMDDYSSGSSSLEEITREQFAQANPSVPLLSGSGHNYMPDSNYIHIPGAYPEGMPWNDNTADMYAFGPHSNTNPFANYLSISSRPEPSNWDWWQQPMPTTTRYQYIPSSSTWQGLDGESFSPDDDEEVFPYSTRDHMGADIGSIRNHGLESIFGASVKTQEEIQNLLQNVRPDEEIPPEKRTGTPKELAVTLMEHQKLGLSWLKSQEEGSNKGSILADDMGLGKTIQALALMVSRPSDEPSRKTTLIVAPLSLLKQWKREIEDKLRPNHRLTVYVYHGPKHGPVTFESLSQFDVVLTTYGKVSAEWTRLQREQKDSSATEAQARNRAAVLFGPQSRWYRVILDEAQYIKNRNTKASKATSELRSIYRLAMTGTPMMNRVNELYPLIHFLRIPPYNSLERFTTDFTKPLTSGSPRVKDRAMTALQVLLKATLLRRTKESKIDNVPIINLPPKTIEVVHAVFDDDQRSFYEAIETQARLQVNKYLKAGAIGKNYSYILVRLLRMRQACCHPHLCKDFATDGNIGGVSDGEMEALAQRLSPDVIKRIRETHGTFECPICYDATMNPLLFFPCGHYACSECLSSMSDPSRAVAEGELRAATRCPECRGQLDIAKVMSYRAFQRVHAPEELPPEDVSEVVKEEDIMDTSESETTSDQRDTDSDDESDDEVDSHGNLRGFIVDRERDSQTDGDEESQLSKVEESGSNMGSTSSKRRIATSNRRDKGKLKVVPAQSQMDLYDEDFSPPNSKESSLKRKRKSVDTKGKKSVRRRRKGTKAKKSKGPRSKRTLNFADLRAQGMRSREAKAKYFARIEKQWITSAKIEKTREILRGIRNKNADEKTLIFSQFTSFLDLLSVGVHQDEWDFRRYDGSMSSGEREDAVDDFMTKPSVKVMLVSLKAGNAGLNLTGANNVIVLDPFWNPFIEDQAVDRAYRIGQTKPVIVHRVLIEGTVEDRILALQDTKRQLINRALDEKEGASLSRLGHQELAYLFGVTNVVPTGTN